MIASATRTKQFEFLNSLTRDELRALPFLFDFWALPHQLPPEGNWKTWIVLGGRGAGKTRAGAEWVRSQVEGSGPLDIGCAQRVALVGETYDQARDVMIFGDSGILSCTPPDRVPVWEASRRRLVWPNGAQAQVFSARDYEALRGPQFDAAWLDEIGCAAVDKGTNQPNRFPDPKSSESGLPKYSIGQRDDLIQMQFLRAVREFWSDASNNPVSGIYDGPMVDPFRIFVWAWDARPYPFFPASSDAWSDGENYARGHWLNGRASSRSLGSVIQEICETSGVQNVNTDKVYGLVRGYSPNNGGEARSTLQPLLLAFGVDTAEDGNGLYFRSRGRLRSAALGNADLAWGEAPALVSRLRRPQAELNGRVRLSYVEADGDYEVRSTENIFPDETTVSVSHNEMPLVLTSGEADGIVERWLAESRIAREGIGFALPASSALDVGDVISLFEGVETYRIDRVEQAGVKLIEATRIESNHYRLGEQDGGIPKLRPISVPVPVWAEVMDLPLLGAEDSPSAPWVAASARPWPGPVAVYTSSGGDDWRHETEIARPAAMGITQNSMSWATPGIWDRGPALRVRLTQGALSSVSDDAVLAGGNVAVIGEAAIDDREVFQFRDAVLVEPDTWELSYRLRGQKGTDGIGPLDWPAGSTVIFLGSGTVQLPNRDSWAGNLLLHRIGPATKPPDHYSYIEIAHESHGTGLRPFKPAHLRVRRSGSDYALTWVRRTRVDGDNWVLPDVPLGEQYEAYVVRVLSGETLRREIVVNRPDWIYSAVEQSSDGITTPFVVEIAQISDLAGPGLAARITIDD